MDLVSVLVYLVVWGLVLYVLWWAVGKLGLPEPFGKIATVILVLLTVVVLLDLLLGFTGGGLGLPRLNLRR